MSDKPIIAAGTGVGMFYIGTMRNQKAFWISDERPRPTDIPDVHFVLETTGILSVFPDGGFVFTVNDSLLGGAICIASSENDVLSYRVKLSDDSKERMDKILPELIKTYKEKHGDSE